MTAQQLIDGALRLIDVLSAPGMSASALEYTACLEALNQMLAAWSAEGVMVYTIAQDQQALTGASSYTIGPSGAINTTRPVRILAARIASGSVSMPLELISAKEWDAIVDRSLSGAFAQKLYADGGYPLQTIHLWPTPQSGGTLYLHSLKPLASLAQLTTTVDLPPGYEQALRYNLAIALAPEFRKPVPAEVAALAAQLKSGLARMNADVLAGLNLPLVGGAAASPERSEGVK